MTESDQPAPEPPHATDLPASHSGTSIDDGPSAGQISKVGDIKTVEDLIIFAYQQEGKRFTVPGQVFETLARRRPRTTASGEEEHDGYDDVDRADPEDPALQLVLRLADQDPLLAVPPRLLIEIEDGNVGAPLRTRLLLLLIAVLKRHPTFRDGTLQDALLTAPADRNTLFDLLRTAAARTHTEELPHANKPLKELKTNEREKLIANAVTSLALLLSLRDRWTTEEFAECLHTHFWHTSTRGSRRPKALLADSRTPDALDVVADIFAAQARRAESRAADQERYAEQASRRALEAEALVERREDELEARAGQIAGLQQRIADLDGELAVERKSRIIDRSHHVDDYESLRTRVIRMLDRQTDLLSDGLHALQNGSAGVTEEYLDRALAAFSRELDQLKKEEGGS